MTGVSIKFEYYIILDKFGYAMFTVSDVAPIPAKSQLTNRLVLILSNDNWWLSER